MEIVTLGLSLSATAGTEVIWEGRTGKSHPLTPCGAMMILVNRNGAGVRAELGTDGVQKGR